VNYFTTEYEPIVEFWLKTRCPICKTDNFSSVSSKTVKDVDAVKCHSCVQPYWVRPLWSIEDLYGHLLTGIHSDDPESDDFEVLDELLDAKPAVVKIVKGKSTAMSIIK